MERRARPFFFEGSTETADDLRCVLRGREADGRVAFGRVAARFFFARAMVQRCFVLPCRRPITRSLAAVAFCRATCSVMDSGSHALAFVHVIDPTVAPVLSSTKNTR